MCNILDKTMQKAELMSIGRVHLGPEEHIDGLSPEEVSDKKWRQFVDDRWKEKYGNKTFEEVLKEIGEENV